MWRLQGKQMTHVEEEWTQTGRAAKQLLDCVLLVDVGNVNILLKLVPCGVVTSSQIL